MRSLVTDYFVPTSELIKERLEVYNISQKELAIRLNMSEKHISELLNNKVLLTMDMAIALEKVINLKYEILMNYEIKYRGYLEKKKQLEELKKENIEEIHNKYQLDFMRRKKWIDVEYRATKEEKVYALLNFFGVNNVNNIIPVYQNKIFQYSFKEDGYQIEPMLVWIRKCELEARKQNVEIYNKEKFKEALKDIKKLMEKVDIDIFNKIKDLCNKNGVYFIMEEAVPNSKVRGAFTWLGDNPVIQISLRYCTNDHFWFAFWHEIGHLLLHANKKQNFIDYPEFDKSNQIENEADCFAQNEIFDEEKYNEFIKRNDFNKIKIINEAKDNNIHPGILLGRLQHDGKVSWNMYSDLKQRYRYI